MVTETPIGEAGTKSVLGEESVLGEAALEN